MKSLRHSGILNLNYLTHNTLCKYRIASIRLSEGGLLISGVIKGGLLEGVGGGGLNRGRAFVNTFVTPKGTLISRGLNAGRGLKRRMWYTYS